MDRLDDGLVQLALEGARVEPPAEQSVTVQRVDTHSVKPDIQQDDQPQRARDETRVAMPIPLRHQEGGQKEETLRSDEGAQAILKVELHHRVSLGRPVSLHEYDRRDQV